mgnify:CR=1 FL=1
MSLNLQDVINLQRKQSMRYNKLKDEILSKLTEKVAHLAKHGQLKCIYNVPLYVFGYPAYNVAEITSFLEKKIKNEGLCALILSKNKLLNLTKHEWKECLKFASKAAAICCTKEGCYPPTEKEINKSRLTQK